MRVRIWNSIIGKWPFVPRVIVDTLIDVLPLQYCQWNIGIELAPLKLSICNVIFYLTTMLETWFHSHTVNVYSNDDCCSLTNWALTKEWKSKLALENNEVIEHTHGCNYSLVTSSSGKWSIEYWYSPVCKSIEQSHYTCRSDN